MLPATAAATAAAQNGIMQQAPASEDAPHTEPGNFCLKGMLLQLFRRGQTEENDAALDFGTATAEVPDQFRRPDFSGVWLLDRVEGDMQKFLKEVGVNSLSRTSAKMLRYGAGRITQNITHAEDMLTVVSTSLKGNHATTFRLDGTEQNSVDPFQGRPLATIPCWEARDTGVLIMESRHSDTGKPMPHTRRYILGEEMCVEQTTLSGVTVRRYFVQK
jgi:hypothetical protein